MKDFEKRLVQPFESALNWRWPGTRIETMYQTGQEFADFLNRWRPGNNFVAVDPNRKRLIIRIHVPESYRKENVEWRRADGSTFILAIALILYSLGLGCLLADSEFDGENGCFTFWTDINEIVYGRLPTPIDDQIEQQHAMPTQIQQAVQRAIFVKK